MAALHTLSKLSPSERIKLQAALQSLNNNSYNRVKKSNRQLVSPMSPLPKSFCLGNNSIGPGADLGILGSMNPSSGLSGSICKPGNSLASQVRIFTSVQSIKIFPADTFAWRKSGLPRNKGN